MKSVGVQLGNAVFRDNVRRGGSQDDVDEGEERYCTAGPLMGLVVLDGYPWELAVLREVRHLPVPVLVESSKGSVYVGLGDPSRGPWVVVQGVQYCPVFPAYVYYHEVVGVMYKACNVWKV